MLLNAFIARRYLFSKKSHNAINIITAIAVMGIGVATAAMICVMSVFNGFRDLVSSLYTTFDPELVVVPTKGKFAPRRRSATHGRAPQSRRAQCLGHPF